MVGWVLILLVVYQAGTVIAALASTAAGGVTAVIVAAITYFCAQRANVGSGNRVWFLMPTALFTVLPLILVTWRLLSSESSLLTWVADLVPLVVGFLLPVLFLWLVYAELGKRIAAPQAR
jgi:hypothetical protein